MNAIVSRITIAAITENHPQDDPGAPFRGASIPSAPTPGASIPRASTRSASIPSASTSDTLFPGAEMQRLTNIPAQPQKGIAAYIDLDFVPDPSRIARLSALLPALVFVNAVTPTLQEIGHAFVRINAWPGFANNKLHELVVPDAATADRIKTLYQQLDCRYSIAPDIPGMISARVVAAIINEAWYTWQHQVSTKEAIDTAMRLGTNYPLGPFEWGDRIGLEEVAGLLQALSKNDERYTPAQSLAEAARIKM